MSALGQKQTCAAHKLMSAKGQKRTKQYVNGKIAPRRVEFDHLSFFCPNTLIYEARTILHFYPLFLRTPFALAHL